MWLSITVQLGQQFLKLEMRLNCKVIYILSNSIYQAVMTNVGVILQKIKVSQHHQWNKCVQNKYRFFKSRSFLALFNVFKQAILEILHIHFVFNTRCGRVPAVTLWSDLHQQVRLVWMFLSNWIWKEQTWPHILWP